MTGRTSDHVSLMLRWLRMMYVSHRVMICLFLIHECIMFYMKPSVTLDTAQCALSYYRLELCDVRISIRNTCLLYGMYMYLCQYVCMSACMYVRMYVCIFTSTHVCRYTASQCWMALTSSSACLVFVYHPRSRRPWRNSTRRFRDNNGVVYVCCMYPCMHVCMYVCIYVWICMYLFFNSMHVGTRYSRTWLVWSSRDKADAWNWATP